jgi:hypothetical protein
MKIRRAVITAAGPSQRSLPLQTPIDRDGAEKAVLQIIVEEAMRAVMDFPRIHSGAPSVMVSPALPRHAIMDSCSFHQPSRSNRYSRRQ